MTQSRDYKNVIQKSKQINSGEQILPQAINEPVAVPTQTQDIPQPVNNNIPNNIVVPTMPNVQYPSVTIPTYVSERQVKYNKILEANNNILKDMNNYKLYQEYINAVEDYRKTYGDITLKSENIANYIPIMKNLGYAYEKISYFDEAIAVLEITLKENSSDINLKKRLLYLYDETKSCIDAENMLNQIKIYEPTYNMNFKNCSDNTPIQNTNQSYQFQNKESHNQEQKPTHEDNYNWDMVYMVYIGLWGLIFFLWLNLDKIELYGQPERTFKYQIKYNSNNAPVKPDIYEFGFDKDSYDEIVQKIDNTGNLDVYDYLMAPISMYIITQIFAAPNIIFPIFKFGWGLIAGIIFYILSILAVNKIKNKFILLKLDSSIKNYNNYITAIKLYDEAKTKYDKELIRIEEEKRKAKERELWKQKDYWYNLDPFEFEEKIGELFRNLGYNVAVTKKSGDGGIDVLIKKGHDTIGVQCKRYKDKVGAKEVRELWAVKDYFKLNGKVQKIDRVIMIALSGVSKPAYEFIQQFPEYELWTINTILAKANEVNYRYS